MYELINSYKNDLVALRETGDYSKYVVKIINDIDENQINRYRLGAALFNHLNIEKDYIIVSIILNEQLKSGESQPNNWDHEILYMYFYFISRFSILEDIWKYAELKFSDWDSDTGFDTEFFLTYGKDKLMLYLSNIAHPLKERLIDRINSFEDSDAQSYEINKISFFGFKLPIENELHACQTLQERELFKLKFSKYKDNLDLTNFRKAYDYVNYAKYTLDNKEIKIALTKFIDNHPTDSSTKQYIKELKQIVEQESNPNSDGWDLIKK